MKSDFESASLHSQSILPRISPSLDMKVTCADTEITTLSAPGKVLLTGGYLVLDPKFTGLVFALNARFYVRIVSTLAPSPGKPTIVVNSPQFLNAIWEYNYRLKDDDGGIKLTQLASSNSPNPHRNIFIEASLTYALSYVSKISNQSIRPISIDIFADNDYYSKTASSSSNGKFMNLGLSINEAHKTGLGSSAALVTTLTAALMIHYLPRDIDLLSEKGLSYVHNLAQAAHCAAQGKIGSGFDVASAVYGSCIYRRFSLEILMSLGEDSSPKFAKRLKEVVEDTCSSVKWDVHIDKCGAIIPSGLRLVMCDVDHGSPTPAMVKRVLSWRFEKPEESNELWANLQTQNDALADELLKLHHSNHHNYEGLRLRISKIRSLMKEMSKLSNVPIEPPEQSRLLDACCSIEGVIGGVVPGAGGFDAVALLIEDRETVVDELEQLFAEFKFFAHDQSSSDSGRITMLRVRQDPYGLRREKSDAIGVS